MLPVQELKLFSSDLGTEGLILPGTPCPFSVNMTLI